MVDSLDAATEDGARAFRRLQTELIGWLTTVNPDGQPQASPIWFLWDGEELLIYSMTRAPRNGNIEDRPLVAFNLESGPEGEDVVTAEGEARIVPGRAAGLGQPDVPGQVPAHVRRLRLDARLVRPALFGADPGQADPLAAVGARIPDAQSSGAISSAARRAPSGSTGR